MGRFVVLLVLGLLPLRQPHPLGDMLRALDDREFGAVKVLRDLHQPGFRVVALDDAGFDEGPVLLQRHAETMTAGNTGSPDGQFVHTDTAAFATAAAKATGKTQHAELAEIDENLIRRKLGPAQEAEAVARRKAIYEELLPETKAEAFKGNRHTGSLASDNLSFASATAAATGKTERTVERVAARGRALGGALKDIAGTSLDKGAELDALAKLPRGERDALVERAKGGEAVSARRKPAGRWCCHRHTRKLPHACLQSKIEE